ncbi:MAG TPA: MlaD family protein [Fibrobacteria bacterium]|nr:MlaD family protein [Fibrobacteria bacterium]
MTNRKNNTVVGLFVLFSIAILLFGVYFLKDATPGQKTDIYEVLFDQVSTLQGGDPVKVNGVNAGKVEAIALEGTRVKVTMKLNRGIALPKDSDVRIQNIGLMGERQIGILLGRSAETVPPGGVLEGSLDAGIAEAMGIAGEVFVEAETLVKSLRAVMDSTVGKPEFVSTFNSLVRQTEDVSGRLSVFLDEIDPKVKTSLANLEQASSQVRIILKDQEAPVKDIIRNGHEVSSRLKDVVEKADKVADEMNRLLARANSDNSTLGAMLGDSTFYVELRSTLTSADSLFRQIEKKGLDVNLNLF